MDDKQKKNSRLSFMNGLLKCLWKQKSDLNKKEKRAPLRNNAESEVNIK